MKRSLLDTESSSPLYKQLIRKLRGDIMSGIYAAHSRIPSEQELCDTYQVSRVTVRKALAELTREGLLERRQGKGTFVSTPRIHKDLRDVNSFHAVCRMMGCVPDSRVIHAGMTDATDEDMERLLTGEGEQVVEIVRLRKADEMPVMLETNHFPAAYSWLLTAPLTKSLYDQLHEHGVEATQAIHEISLVYADASEARLLELNPGEALLCLNEIIYDQHGHPLHTSIQKIRGDRFTFRI